MTAAALQRIRDLVGPRGWTSEPAEVAPYMQEWRGRFQGATLMVVRPATTAEVAGVVAICAEAGLPIVPQGGNTGLVGGGIPYESGTEILLSLSRLNQIRDVDPLDYTMTVEAGCVLATLQQAAAAVDRQLPLTFGAEGTAQIGGCLGTNAGGMLTIRYGNTRDLVLGIEAVLPDGQIWNGLRRLRKNNTGYEIKHLLIGAEGTLGIITAAVLRLFPRPRQVETAFLAVPDPAAAIAVLAHLRETTGDAVTRFELIPRLGLDFALRHVAGVIDPLDQPYPWYVIAEVCAGTASDQFREDFETALGSCLEAGQVVDAAIAASEAQTQAFWLIREAIVEAQRFEGGSLKNDVSVPVSRVADFITQATEALAALIPGVRLIPFGHVGDGNIHLNMNQPVGADSATFLARWDEVQTLVNDIVLGLDGSISAEHGIGRIKRTELARVKSPLELDLMRRIKSAFDPKGLMNPGKLLP